MPKTNIMTLLVVNSLNFFPTLLSSGSLKSSSSSSTTYFTSSSVLPLWIALIGGCKLSEAEILAEFESKLSSSTSGLTHLIAIGSISPLNVTVDLCKVLTSVSVLKFFASYDSL